jgi:hypothetical protein
MTPFESVDDVAFPVPSSIAKQGRVSLKCDPLPGTGTRVGRIACNDIIVRLAHIIR